MLRAICFAIALVIAASGSRATEPSAADRAAIETVIEQQITAFKRDDAATAYSFASPMIQKRFGDAATFLRMVRKGYKPVYRPQTVEFKNLETVRDMTIQRLFVIGQDGTAVQALYYMEKQADGTWRIDGVQLIAAPDEAV